MTHSIHDDVSQLIRQLLVNLKDNRESVQKTQIQNGANGATSCPGAEACCHYIYTGTHQCIHSPSKLLVQYVHLSLHEQLIL